MDNKTKLEQIFVDIFQMERSQVNDETSVDTVEKWDSLAHLNLVLALEETFGVTFTEEQSVEILNYPLIKTILSEHGILF